MIHVLLCPHTLDYGGAQLSIHHWAKFLDKSKFKVTILAMKKGGLSEKFEAYYPVYYDDIEYPGITEYIKKLKPDILHAAPGGGRDLEYISKAVKLVPVTQTVMCPRVVSNRGEVCESIVLSKYVLSLQKKLENIIQIDPPFDTSDYDVKYSKKHFSLPDGKLIIGSLGNMRRENDHFIKIARNYKSNDVHFVIKTNLKYQQLLKFKFLLGRKNVTIINKNISEDEKLSLMKCFDIFLYPTSNEAYGVVFLEAMSQRVPIISYDNSAMPEAIGDGGLLAPLNDIKKMTSLLDELVKNSAKRKTLGQAGYKLFLKRNDPKAIAKKYEGFFEKALEKAKSADEI